MNSAHDGLARSVQVRLARHAKAIGVDPNLVLTRYALERFLYRLSRSPHVEKFVLKGALLLLVWLGETIRPTRDADFLGFGDFSDEALLRIFREVCAVDVEPDAMRYVPDTARIELIRPEDAYGGRRVTLQSELGAARLRVQIDIGIGDVVSPGPTWIDYPGLLDLPRPRLQVYTPESVVAEKVHAMVMLGARNSRLRDFFDVDALAQRTAFDGTTLTTAIRATFERRRTVLPTSTPVALTAAFHEAVDKQTQWRAFRTKIGASVAPEALRDVVERLALFLVPVLDACRSQATFPAQWPPGGPWIPK
jgi:predicted nucleotidyltransferase component of viral defense system